MATEWQWHYLKRDLIEGATDADTFRVKLPEREQISMIELTFQAQRHATGYDWTDDIWDIPTKIEVIADGSKVLYSMTPETGSFIHLCTCRQIPFIKTGITGNKVCTMKLKIPFGRWERDEEYMLDTGQYNNVYLEVPWILTVAHWVTHTMTWTVRYLRPIQTLSPKGFIRSRDIEYGQHAWTATGEYEVDLPLEFPWYRLGFRCWDVDEQMWNDITEVKLDIDDGRLVLVDNFLDDLLMEDQNLLPNPLHVHYTHNHCATAASSYVQSCLADVLELSGSEMGDTQGSLFWQGQYGQQCEYWIYNYLGAKVEARVNLTLHGYGYYCNCTIKHWEKTDPFPVKDHSMAKIVYAHGAFTVTDLRTWLQEVCPLRLT